VNISLATKGIITAPRQGAGMLKHGGILCIQKLFQYFNLIINILTIYREEENCGQGGKYV